jgi:uncharacterized protein (DUF2249 family)
MTKKEHFHMSHQATASNQPSRPGLDVRTLAPRERHPLIFRTFDELNPGQTFVLVNDHDPKPLYYQFLYERENQFTWEYLDQGPDVWRVQIGKRAE